MGEITKRQLLDALVGLPDDGPVVVWDADTETEYTIAQAVVERLPDGHLLGTLAVNGELPAPEPTSGPVRYAFEP